MNNTKYSVITADSVRTLRRKLNLNQADFWNRIGVTQSGGSRYESGRNIPAPVQLLIKLVYKPEKEAASFISKLRDMSATKL